MAFDGSTLLSRLDMSDVENVKDADHQLRRCVSDADFAAWARKWGGASMQALRDAPPSDWVDSDVVAEAEREATEAEEALASLKLVVEACANDLAGITELRFDHVAAKVDAITSKLEAAL